MTSLRLFSRPVCWLIGHDRRDWLAIWHSGYFCVRCSKSLGFCGSTKDSCRCQLQADHDATSPHVCECGGAWDAYGRVVDFPRDGRDWGLPVPQPGALWAPLGDGTFTRASRGAGAQSKPESGAR